MEYIYLHADKIIALGSLFCCSLMLRVALQVFAQQWVVTIAHTSTLFLLPIITYAITSVISGNIALSLGMVGALSIVRFRNPVRSPLELSAYFASITMGIAASVDLIWLFFLVFALGFSGVGLWIIHIISSRLLRKPFFLASFNEGNHLSTLEVVSADVVEDLDQHPRLVHKRSSEGKIQYRLASHSFEELASLENSLQSDSAFFHIDLKR